MSEHSHDDEELEAFLSRDSALSRRYRESSGEQPPEHVDAAILAASRWAVGADRISADRTGADRISADRTSSERTGAGTTGADRNGREARHTGSDFGQALRAGARWRRSVVARWSVPLAMAAVVVLAVTLTITIERDPELDRIYQRYDSPAPAEGETVRDDAMAEADVAAPRPPAAKAVSPGLTATSSEPAPASPLAKQEPADTLPADLLPQVKEQIARQPAQQNRLAARKRSEMSQQGLAADQTVKRDTPATVAEEQVAEKVAPASTTVAPFPDGPSAETKAAGDGDAGMTDLDDIARLGEAASVDEIASPVEARDDSAFAGARALPEAEQSPPAAAVAPGRQQALAPAPLAVPLDERETAEQEMAERGLAESVQPAEIVAAESVREPEPFREPVQIREPVRWIEDIEELLAQGRRDEAVDSLKAFRTEYPDYELPPDLLALLPAAAE